MPAENNSEDKNNKNHMASHMRHMPSGWLIAFCAIIVLFVAFAIGVGAGRFSNVQFGTREGRHMGGFMMGGGSMRFGDNRIANSQDRVSGTVTAVNGSSITVAGHGSSYQVQTSGSTQYQNGSAVKVNDSVIAFGTTNSGVLSATQVLINP